MLREEPIRFSNNELRKQTTFPSVVSMDAEKPVSRRDSRKLHDSEPHQRGKRKCNPRYLKLRFLFSSGSSLFCIWLSQLQRLLTRSQIFRRMCRQSRLISKATWNNSHHDFTSLRQHHDLMQRRRLYQLKWYFMHPMHYARAFSRRKKRNTFIVRKRPSPSSPSHSDIPSNDDSVASTDLSPPSSTSAAAASSSSSSLKGMVDRRHSRPIKHARKIKTWVPPINSETLHELSIANIFKSIQLRHDLLFDPSLSFRPNLDGSSGREKCKKAQRYWHRVDRAFQRIQCGPTADGDSLDCLRIILTELYKILLSLFSPFASTPAQYEPWHWPNHISLDSLCTVFDVDFMIHQIKHGSFCLDPVATVLMDILTPLCPINEIAHLVLLQRYLIEEHFCKAMCQCFSILEAIKLDCANTVLHRYRSYLINTCAQVELHCFKKQWEGGEIKLDSTYNWLRYNWHQQNGKQTTFLDIYYHGLLQFVSKDANKLMDKDQQVITFPITLQFDEKRLTMQLREEFQSLLLVSIVLIPYRYLAGPYVTKSDMARLKRTCIDIFKDYAGDQTKLLKVPGDRQDDILFRLCYRLAYKACYRAFQTHHHRHNVELTAALMGPDQLCQVSQFWANWLLVHLNASSPIHTLAYDRLCNILRFLSQYGPTALKTRTDMAEHLDRMVGMQENVLNLGEKLKTLADLNLDTFGSVYKALAVDLIHHHHS